MQNVSVNKLLEAIEVHNGVADIDGILCKGAYNQIGKAIYDALCEYGCKATCEKVTHIVIDAYNKHSDSGKVKPTCSNLVEILTE